MALKDLTNKIMDWKAFLNSMAGVLLMIAAASTQIEDTVDDISARIYSKVTTPVYIYIEYDLLKQLEKLANDPTDIKDMDVQKFAEYCDKDEYFKNVWIPNSDNSRGLTIACDKLTALFDDRYSYGKSN